MSYDHLDRNGPRTVRDHTDRWNRLVPVTNAGDGVRARIMKFCDSKNISFSALEAMDTRVTTNGDNGPCLAYAGLSPGTGRVVAIKYRPINGTSHDSFAEKPSSWLLPMIIGKRDSLDWLIAEGETDGARLYDLVGDRCAILILPTGAKAAFRPEWAGIIPRGATVRLCHDADPDGDTGAAEAGRIIGGRTIRVRPPVEGGDWCDWTGTAEEFIKLARPQPRYEFTTYAEFASRELPVAEPLLGESGRILLARGSLLMVYGSDGSGKSTWSIDGLVHLAAGTPWLGVPVPRPVRVCIIENEGPPGLFQRKLADKLATWEGTEPRANLFVYANPWGGFSFADPDARAALREYCQDNGIDVVAANPTLALGVGASGRPDETQEFVGWLVECGLYRDCAFWLLHHENKQGQISGDWGRHPDTKVSLQPDGNRQRTKLTWAKTRWATLEPEEKAVLLEWVTDSWGYSVIKQENAGTTDEELDSRIVAFLSENPLSSTNTVEERVEGAKRRIRARLDAADSPFDSTKGPRRSLRWFVRGGSVADQSFDCAKGSVAQLDQWRENP